jgi:hypothetical protein
MEDAMSVMAQHNFHVPMPAGLYRNLRAEAQRRGIPATVLARQVLEAWLAAHRRLRVAEEIAAYAAAAGGTADDLDPGLEAAAIEALRRESNP